MNKEILTDFRSPSKMKELTGIKDMIFENFRKISVVQDNVTPLELNITKGKDSGAINLGEVIMKTMDYIYQVEDLVERSRVQEFAGLIFFDGQLTPTAYAIPFAGKQGTTLFDDRFLILCASATMSDYVVMFHNHPEFNVGFSEGDINASSRMAGVMKLIDVNLLDLLVVSYQGTEGQPFLINSLRNNTNTEDKTKIMDLMNQLETAKVALEGAQLLYQLRNAGFKIRKGYESGGQTEMSL